MIKFTYDTTAQSERIPDILREMKGVEVGAIKSGARRSSVTITITAPFDSAEYAEEFDQTRAQQVENIIRSLAPDAVVS